MVDAAQSYTTRHFAVMVQATNNSRSNNPAILARLRNSLVHAINRCTQLPKIVVIVLEDDLLESINPNENLAAALNKRIRWLMHEYRKIIDTTKDFLPQNAKNDGYPKFLWINLTKHCNYTNNTERKKLGTCMENMSKFFDNNVSLRLVHKWEFSDTNLFLKEQQRFTSEGLNTFWTALDKTIEYFETKWTAASTTASATDDRNRHARDPVWDRGIDRDSRRRRRSGDRQEHDNFRRRLPVPPHYRR